MPRNDEIIAVDGMEIYAETIQEAIIGDDTEGSMVTLTIRKDHTGNIFDVVLKRVSKRSMQPMVELFEQCDALFKRFSVSDEPSGMFGERKLDVSQSPVLTVNKIRSLISKVIIDRYGATFGIRFEKYVLIT